MLIYVTAGVYERGIVAIEAERFEGHNCTRFSVEHSGGVDYYTLGIHCELTEAAARKVVRARTAQQRDEMIEQLVAMNVWLQNRKNPPLVQGG